MSPAAASSPRHQLHHHPHHRRRARRLPGRAGPLSAGRRPGLPVGQPRHHRPPPAGFGRRSLHWLLRAHPRRAQLDVRSGPRRRRPGAEDPAAAGRLLQALSRLPQGHHRPGDRRCSDGSGGHQRLRPDDARLLDGVDGISPRRRTRAVPRGAAGRDRRGGQRVYTEINNGVYRCGFAGSQDAYEPGLRSAVHRIGLGLDRLAGQRYLVGDTITEADVRLFTTLARFDPVYHGHFKCNRAS